MAVAEQVWEDRDDAREFLGRPHPVLQDRSPLETAETEPGVRRVERLLMMPEYGLPVRRPRSIASPGRRTPCSTARGHAWKAAGGTLPAASSCTAPPASRAARAYGDAWPTGARTAVLFRV
jgi:hypothetical protein